MRPRGYVQVCGDSYVISKLQYHLELLGASMDHATILTIRTGDPPTCHSCGWWTLNMQMTRGSRGGHSNLAWNRAQQRVRFGTKLNDILHADSLNCLGKSKRRAASKCRGDGSRLLPNPRRVSMEFHPPTDNEDRRVSGMQSIVE